MGFAWSMTVSSSAQTSKTLDIYVIDVEGGNAQLYVSPSGQSVLIDSGNIGPGATRDADRIMAAVHDAGVKQIDYLITTHYHPDHFGGLPEIATRIRIANFVDHGPNTQPDPRIDPVLKRYAELYMEARHTIAKPGDRIPIAGLNWLIVSAGGSTLKTPLPGGGDTNPYCVDFQRQILNPISGQLADATEDTQSVGSQITFGKFRALYLGDLVWNKEFELMCPTNLVGTSDVLVTSRHGQSSSNSELLVHAVRPRVILMNNGIRKGGQPEAMKVFFSSPGLENVWQIHFSQLSGQEYTVPGLFIANASDDRPLSLPIEPMKVSSQDPGAPQHEGNAYYLKVSAQPDGTFTVTNSRDGFSKTYRSRN
jgi:beta-lactamase superfamily II metal-dependent hydrolase